MLYPDHDFKTISDIPASFLSGHGITALLIDADNTLTHDNSQEVLPEVSLWLEQRRAEGMRLFIISNNSEERVRPFARALGVGYIAKAGKPLPGAVRRAMAQLDVHIGETALIGDQIFTDILCGNLLGVLTILVEPFAMEGYGQFLIKRQLEKPVLRGYAKQKERRNRK